MTVGSAELRVAGARVAGARVAGACVRVECTGVSARRLRRFVFQTFAVRALHPSTIRYIACMGSADIAGALLRRARKRSGLSQSELAARAGTAQSVISVYESGRRQPSLPMLMSLVEATGLHLRVELSDGHGRASTRTSEGTLSRPVRDNADGSG